ncbi:hypothetical protein LPJ71_000067 [Coemansia sp. S17]|nr:hypothetical protein LPJ71_000067 [Coemansia sp. S17]
MLSPLQVLPQHVVQLVVNHVVGSSRVVLDGVRANSHEYRMLLKPLLWVCRNFRVVAYSRYCNHFNLNLSGTPFDELVQHYLRTCRSSLGCLALNNLGYPTHHLAKDLTIYLDERSVYSGKALEVVSRAPYDGCSFPLVRKLTFLFGKDTADKADEDIWNDPALVEANIDAFVERIRQMAPLVSEIRVKAAESEDMPRIANRHFSDLASRLYQLSYRVEYNYVSQAADLMRLRLDMISNLTHLSYISESEFGNGSQFLQLVRMNALTLQSLVLECEHDIDVLGLVQDADGNHIAYPCLLTLKMWAVSDTDESRQPVFRGAAPFPILRRLRIILGRPFDDDTFFRGNAATLEWLDMPLDSLSVSMLRKYKVFAPGSHPKLQMVCIGYTRDFGAVFASPTEAIEYMYNIGSGAAIRDYVNSGRIQDRTPMLPSPGSHECIQVLSLSTLLPELWHVLTLVKSLPLLSDLHTSVPSLGPIPDGVTLDTLPEYVISNYAPMGKRFRCWHLDKYPVYKFSEVTTCVLLLALACPNLDCAPLPIDQRKPLMEQMERDIGSDCFKPYAPRLRRLLFNGWDGKKD